MEGKLLIDKPAGYSSFYCVNYIRRIIASKVGVKPLKIKVGHSGTLDPFATGLLILLIGKAYTKKASELLKQDKTYEVTVEFGKSSNTGDKDGEITQHQDKQITKQEVLDVLASFVGMQYQTPPQFSAIKINGQRAYDLARSGQTVEIKPRQIEIYSLELIEFNYPYLRYKTEVSSGTYIRVLTEDIAKKLKTHAYTRELRRTTIGQYNLEDAVKFEGLDYDLIDKNITK